MRDFVEKNIKQIDFKNLLSRQEYFVVQGNDLAKSFGNLQLFEHKILDFCISYVTAENNVTEKFVTSSREIINHLGLTTSGGNYERIIRAFKTLNENTALYFLERRDDGKEVLVMGQLFQRIEIAKDGEITFQFSNLVAPYVFELKKNYYSFKLRELSQIKSKYTLIMMKQWEANRYKDNQSTIIKGSIEDFKKWFLGDISKEKEKKWTAARFNQQVITVALNEIEKKIPNVSTECKTLKYGRKVIGYEIIIHDFRGNR